MAVSERILIVGCGPGSRECLTLEALLAVESAEIILGTRRLLDLFPDSNAKRIMLRGYRQEAIDVLTQCVGQRVAVLVTGDPGLASLATTVIGHCGIDACRVVPGISSVQVAFARLGLSWESARIISSHAFPPELEFESLKREQTIAVLSGNAESMHWITSLADVLGDEWQVTVAKDLTLQSEQILEVAAKELETLPQPLRAVIIFRRKSKA